MPSWKPYCTDKGCDYDYQCCRAADGTCNNTGAVSLPWYSDGTDGLAYGTPKVDEVRFPDMKGMVSKAHGLGLRAGWYAGNYQCSGANSRSKDQAPWDMARLVQGKPILPRTRARERESEGERDRERERERERERKREMHIMHVQRVRETQRNRGRGKDRGQHAGCRHLVVSGAPHHPHRRWLRCAALGCLAVAWRLRRPRGGDQGLRVRQRQVRQRLRDLLQHVPLGRVREEQNAVISKYQTWA